MEDIGRLACYNHAVTTRKQVLDLRKSSPFRRTHKGGRTDQTRHKYFGESADFVSALKHAYYELLYRFSRWRRQTIAVPLLALLRQKITSAKNPEGKENHLVI